MDLSCTQIFPAFQQKSPVTSNLKSQNRISSQSVIQTASQPVSQSVKTSIPDTIVTK